MLCCDSTVLGAPRVTARSVVSSPKPHATICVASGDCRRRSRERIRRLPRVQRARADAADNWPSQDTPVGHLRREHMEGPLLGSSLASRTLPIQSVGTRTARDTAKSIGPTGPTLMQARSPGMRAVQDTAAPPLTPATLPAWRRHTCTSRARCTVLGGSVVHEPGDSGVSLQAEALCSQAL